MGQVEQHICMVSSHFLRGDTAGWKPREKCLYLHENRMSELGGCSESGFTIRMESEYLDDEQHVKC